MLGQQWLTEGNYKQRGDGMRGAGQMVYGALKWSESPFTGSCLSAPGWLNRSAGFSLTEWKRQTERERQEGRDLSVYRDVILLLYVTKVVNHSVNTCRVKGWVAKVMAKPCANTPSWSVAVDESTLTLDVNSCPEHKITAKFRKWHKNLQLFVNWWNMRLWICLCNFFHMWPLVIQEVKAVVSSVLYFTTVKHVSKIQNKEAIWKKGLLAPQFDDNYIIFILPHSCVLYLIMSVLIFNQSVLKITECKKKWHVTK